MPFPPAVDNTMVVDYLACPTRFFRRHILGLTPPTKSGHLVAGGAFAAALEAVRRSYYTNDGDESLAMTKGLAAFTRSWGDYEPPDNFTKTFARTWSAVEYYFEQYPLATDEIQPLPSSKVDGIEFTFAVPLPLDHPESGDPLLYAGRFDMLGSYNGLPTVIDEKTTSSLGSSWGDNWALRSQFIGYVWAANQHGLDCEHAVIRGIAILKTMYNTAQTLHTYPSYLQERWYTNLISTLERMIADYKRSPEDEASWGLNLAESCNAYGGCTYRDLCRVTNPAEWYGNFTVSHWSPLNP